jgi:hypothetical protein
MTENVCHVGEQLDQRDSEIGLGTVRPLGHLGGDQIDQGLTETVVVPRHVIDRLSLFSEVDRSHKRFPDGARLERYLHLTALELVAAYVDDLDR